MRHGYPTLLGAALGFIMFLLFGLVPSMLWGCMGGLVLANAAHGSELAAKALMMLGIVVCVVGGGLIFAMLGAFVSDAVCSLFRKGVNSGQ
jgi:hypothetical protein